jgi:large subunit ribosomal protein L17e
MSSPCHIEIIVTEENAQIKRESDATKKVQRLNRRQLARRRLIAPSQPQPQAQA